MDTADKRQELERASTRALVLVTRGVTVLVMMIPLILIGGLLVALTGRSAELVVSLLLGLAGAICGVLGLGLVIAGLVRHTFLQRSLAALDRAPLPTARVIDK